MTDFQFVNTDTFDKIASSESRFFCAICDRKLNDIHLTDKELEERFKTKHGFNCNVCYKVYRSLNALKEHQNEHFDGRELRVACIQCTNASKTFDTGCGILEIGEITDSMELYNDKAEKEPRHHPYQCEKCHGTFSRRMFKAHIDNSDCYMENQCLTCCKRFIKKSELNEHRLADCVKMENLDSRHDCAKCDKSFNTKQGLVLHASVCRKWRKKPTIRCDICGILVESDTNHWNDIHRRKPVVKLKRVANVMDGLKTCAKNLSTEIQFGCLLCDDTFGDREQLRFHLKSHYCDKAVQTVADGQCETMWESIDPNSKHLDTLNLKDEKMESSPMEERGDENNFPFSNAAELVKTENSVNYEDMWTSNSDNFDHFTNDDPEGMSDTGTSNDVIQHNVRTTMCCLCNNVIPDLINTDDVVQQQVSRYGECICLICFQLFNQAEKLRVHELSHFHENLEGHSIACRSCAWSLSVYYTDDEFFRLETELQCYMCSAKMADLRTLRRHKRSHLSLCVFTCKVCNKKSISEERHRNHLRKHQKAELTLVTSQIDRKCTVCGEEATNLFRDEKDIDRMFEKFKGGPCKICFTYINDKKRYISHERSHMNDQQLVSCFKCCNTQPYTDDEYHRLEDENACFICKAKLSSKYNLHLHKRKHLDRVVYSCTVCLSLVVGTRNHSHHMYKHGLRKKNREEETGRFECDYCQKVFPHKSSLPAHFKQHLNKQRVPCPQCTLTFACKGNLTQHIKQIHLCGKAFGHPHNLKSHQRL